jgi:hypothetical protein
MSGGMGRIMSAIVSVLRVAANAATATLTHNGTDVELITATGGIIQTAPNAAATLTANSQLSMHLDEVGNTVTFTCKYSDGTAKSGTVALT